MSILQSFPFKNMLLIVNLLKDNEEISITEIARATGMCSFDSREVTDMLAYLTTFGRVEEAAEGWKIVDIGKGSVYGNFREAFLEALGKILRQLSPTVKPASQLAQEAQVPQELVEEYLAFLAEITQLGVISRCPSGNIPSSWCLLPSD